MRFKRIYIEITNICNLNCSFCLPHNRENRNMTFDEFKIVLEKIKDYSEYIYLHVKGEPLSHPDIKQFVKYANEKEFKINLTTNGTLLKYNLDITKYLRQINISLHDTNDLEILEEAMKIKDTLVSLRIWNMDKNRKFVDKVQEYFNIEINSEKRRTLSENMFLSQQEEFEWPSLENEIKNEEGYCYGLKNQIAILVDGTVIPCCLDNEGDINLGNIFNEDMEDILQKEKAIKIIDGFKNRVAVEELCKKCSYKNRF